MRVFIIGFMCSGKSIVGRELATMTGRRFADIDRVIEQRIGPILPWMKQHGEAKFREVESEVLAELLQEEDVLVACGGGTPMASDNMERMLAAGTVVYLDVPHEILVERARRSGGDRPLLFGLKDDALSDRIKELMLVREPKYRRAPVHVPGGGTPAETAKQMAEMLGLQER
ncbi:MAG: shikimate kinase [Flavobacteriales bacterium]|jgi:shikimate kinase|nr:shikimate kinase [Flavobacteriales bacterium]MBK7287439.1 shikimate kinase [Flavobacteriales bacterium]MBK9059604.1 shikimate kinase [Flavobacteriales bacterium]MBK9598040.1 shikimate kinase [Flavobacteriales bacterium]QQS73472.1 MAG: shikimate kinase [Flavobacteriales bacterium]